MATGNSATASTPEYEAFRKCYQTIIRNVKLEPGAFCDALFAKGYISPSVRDQTRNKYILSDEEKAQKLTDILIDRIEQDPDAYHSFIKILEEAGPWADDFVKTLKDSYEAEVNTERHADTSENSSSSDESFHSATADLDQSSLETKFPYLDVSSLSEDQKDNLEAKLRSDIRKIKKRFSDFRMAIRDSLEARVTLDKIKDSILSLDAFSDGIGVKVLDPQDAEKIESADSLSKVFMALRNYVSFFNYEIIEQLIHQYGSNKDKKKLDEYSKVLNVFYQRNIYEIPPSAYSKSNSRPQAKKFILKCTHDTLTLQDVRAIKEKVAEILGLDYSTLQLGTIEKGCVELHFLISAAVADRIFPVSPSQHSALSEIGVKVRGHQDETKAVLTTPQDVTERKCLEDSKGQTSTQTVYHHYENMREIHRHSEEKIQLSQVSQHQLSQDPYNEPTSTSPWVHQQSKMSESWQPPTQTQLPEPSKPPPSQAARQDDPLSWSHDPGYSFELNDSLNTESSYSTHSDPSTCTSSEGNISLASNPNLSGNVPHKFSIPDPKLSNKENPLDYYRNLTGEKSKEFGDITPSKYYQEKYVDTPSAESEGTLLTIDTLPSVKKSSLTASSYESSEGESTPGLIVNPHQHPSLVSRSGSELSDQTVDRPRLHITLEEVEEMEELSEERKSEYKESISSVMTNPAGPMQCFSQYSSYSVSGDFQQSFEQLSMQYLSEVGRAGFHDKCTAGPPGLSIASGESLPPNNKIRPNVFSMSGPSDAAGSTHHQQETPEEPQGELVLAFSSHVQRHSQSTIADGDVLPCEIFKPFELKPGKKCKIQLSFIKVEPVRGDRQLSEHHSVYPMNQRLHGLAVIINNANPSHKLREGTRIDEENLIVTFCYLGYNVEVYRDLSTKQMCGLFEEVKRRNHSQYDSFVCCILTHGKSGEIFGSDSSSIVIDTLTEQLCAAKCSQLGGKPKIFFIQACRGDRKCQKVTTDRADTSEGQTEEEVTEREMHNVSSDSPVNILSRAIERSLSRDTCRVELDSDIPGDADFFFGYATPSGRVAWRDMHAGSWYISELCRALCEFSLTLPLSDIILKVHKEVGERYQHNNYKQAPEMTSRLTDKVFF